MKRSKEWRYNSSPRNEKIQHKTICGKGYAGSLLGWTRGNFGALHSQGDHCDQCNVCRSHQESLRPAIKSKRRWVFSTGVLLQHGNPRPHTARSTVAAIQDLSFECLPHPPYSPDLAPSDFHVFGPLKRAIGSKSFRSAKKCSRRWQSAYTLSQKIFFSTRIHAIPKRWNICMERNGDYVEKWCNCVPCVFNKSRDKNI